MKINKAVTETVVNYIHLTFEKEYLDLGEFKVLIIASGVSRQDASEFICENKINYQRLEEEIASSDNFFLNLSTNLLPYLEKEQREIFKRIMKKFGYILGVNKRFRKGTKPELVDYSETEAVKKIEIYKDEDINRFRLAVNGKLLNWIKPRKNSDKPYLQCLYEIADNGRCYIGSIKKANEIKQWFNSKSKKRENPIYKHTGFDVTEIISFSSDYLISAKGVQVKKMSENKTYAKKS